MPELGTRFFLGLRAPGESSLRLRFRALFWPQISRFCVWAFALLRSLIFRTPGFRARIFVLLDFRARNFVLVCLYTARTDSQDRTARTGHPGQDTQNRTGRTGQAEQDSQNKTARTGQQEQDRQNKIGRTRLP